MWDMFMNFDLYGQPIELNYSGSKSSGNTFRTGFGGMLTCLTIAFICFAVFMDLTMKNDKVELWLTRVETSFSQTSLTIIQLRKELKEEIAELREKQGKFHKLILLSPFSSPFRRTDCWPGCP